MVCLFIQQKGILGFLLFIPKGDNISLRVAFINEVSSVYSRTWPLILEISIPDFRQHANIFLKIHLKLTKLLILMYMKSKCPIHC